MLNTSRHAIRALLLFTAVMAVTYADEAPRQYDIELLIFQNLSADDGGEVWPVDYSGWFNEDTSELNATASGIAPRPTWLEPETLQLRAEQQAMKRSGNYRPLRHLAWRQTVVDRDRAQGIEIPAVSGDNPARIEGTVRVAVERYLHLYLDLKLIDTSLARGTEVSDYDLPEFRLNQRRRMRSKELHYFDHPKFGVIALITPYVPPTPQPENAAQSPIDEPAIKPGQ